MFRGSGIGDKYLICYVAVYKGENLADGCEFLAERGCFVFFVLYESLVCTSVGTNIITYLRLPYLFAIFGTKKTTRLKIPIYLENYIRN